MSQLDKSLNSLGFASRDAGRRGAQNNQTVFFVNSRALRLFVVFNLCLFTVSCSRFVRPNFVCLSGVQVLHRHLCDYETKSLTNFNDLHEEVSNNES